FDKRTALGISPRFMPSISPSVLSQGLARSICTEVSNELKYFPEEVKAKHEDNVKQAGIDEFGEEFYSDKCTIV
ncbi:MAG: hypothetical protein Q9165_004832, partial [Trypethelium subeluteriae]